MNKSTSIATIRFIILLHCPPHLIVSVILILKQQEKAEVFSDNSWL